MVVIAPRGAKRSEREDQAIKGPGIRLDLDVRRVWRCPSCQRVLKTAGHITARRCPIDGAFMQLDDSAQRAARRFSFPPITIEETDDTVVVEPPPTPTPTQPTTDDDDRPRIQSRKQKRRRRQKPGGSPSEDDAPEGSQADASPCDDSPVTETVEPDADPDADPEGSPDEPGDGPVT